ncbi:LptF/LptG family permease, partial [bacterium]|nr:LptF/LptG family permease [bacterium]
SVLALCLVGVPLGIWIRKESRLASFALAVVVFLMLYAMLIGGEGMALEQKIPPKVALWTPVFATGMLGALMLLRTFRR